jgi:hypothetical protein
MLHNTMTPPFDSCSANERDLFLTLQRIFPGLELKNLQGAHAGDYYDPDTRTLTLPGHCIFGPKVTDADIASFKIVSHLNGSLILQDNARITGLQGLSSLQSIQGDLVLTGTGLKQISGLNALKSVGGNIAISHNTNLLSLEGFSSLEHLGNGLSLASNPVLTAINGFISLKRIEQGNLEILDNPTLQNISGFDTLEGICGTLHLEQCPKLENVNFLAGLIHVVNLQINKVKLDDPSPLRKLFLANSRFPGFIKITSCSLQDLTFMKGLQHVDSSFYLNNNLLTNLHGLESLEGTGASFSLAGNRISDLGPLRQLKRINGILSVANNALISLTGLESLRSLRTKKWNNSPSTLRIYGNPDLHDISAIANVHAADQIFFLHLDKAQAFTGKPPLEPFFKRNIVQIINFRSGSVIPTYCFVHEDSHAYCRFRTAVPVETIECMVDFETDADTLIISFPDPLSTDCWRMVEGLKAHKLILADYRGLCFLEGFAGITRNLEETLSFIQKIASSPSYKQIICYGKSAGGFLAMLFGWLIKADYVIALNPPACFHDALLHCLGDQRFGHDLGKLLEGIDPAYLEIESLFTAYPNMHTEIRVFSNDPAAIDRSRLLRLPNRECIRASTYDIYEKMLAMGHSEGDAMNAEAFLAFCSVLDEPYEFINNEAFSHSAENQQQITIAINLAAWLYNHFRNNRFRIHMADKKLLVAASGSLLHPDLFVTRAESPPSQNFFEEALLVVEVLNGTTMAFARGRRFPLLTRVPTLCEYVTIDAQNHQVRIWRRVGSRWVEYEPSSPSGELNLESLGVAIPETLLFANLS